MVRNSIGQFIAVLRKSNGMTQQEVADRLNVSNKAVSRWERDECAPDISVIPALAEMFGVTCDELLRGERSNNNINSNNNNVSFENTDIKFEKQIKRLFNRTLSRFKMHILVAFSSTVVGLIFMIFLSKGSGGTTIGIPLMMLFEACSLAVTGSAVSRTNEVKDDNELFEMAEKEQTDRFNRVVGSLSFWSFFAMVSSILLPISFLYEPTFKFNRLSVSIVDLLILLLLYIRFKKPYLNWIAKGELVSFKLSASRGDFLLLLQNVLTAVAGLIFIVEAHFQNSNSAKPFSAESPIWLIVELGFTLAGVAVFCLLVAKQKNERGRSILFGIKNFLLLPPAVLFAKMPSNAWTDNYLIGSVAFFFAMLVAFSLKDSFSKSKSEKSYGLNIIYFVSMLAIIVCLFCFSK